MKYKSFHYLSIFLATQNGNQIYESGNVNLSFSFSFFFSTSYWLKTSKLTSFSIFEFLNYIRRQQQQQAFLLCITLGLQTTWDKYEVLLQMYWATLGNLLGTSWEHDENTLGTRKKNKKKSLPFTSHCPEFLKKLDLSCVHAESSHWLHETFISKTICHHFQYGGHQLWDIVL